MARYFAAVLMAASMCLTAEGRVTVTGRITDSKATAEDLESGRHSWEVRAVFTVPTNKANVLTYTCQHITRDYSEF